MEDRPSSLAEDRHSSVREDRSLSAREDRRRVWMNNTPKNLIYNGERDWCSFEFQFLSYSEQMNVLPNQKKDLLMSVLTGSALKFVIGLPMYGTMSCTEIMDKLKRRFDEGAPVGALWLRLDNAQQGQGEGLHEWAERLGDLAARIAGKTPAAREAITPRVIMQFCLGCNDKRAGQKTFENGPPRSLPDAVESIRWHQHLIEASQASRRNCSPSPERQNGRNGRPIGDPPRREIPNIREVGEIREPMPEWAKVLMENLNSASGPSVRSVEKSEPKIGEERIGSNKILQQLMEVNGKAIREVAKGVDKMSDSLAKLTSSLDQLSWQRNPRSSFRGPEMTGAEGR